MRETRRFFLDLVRVAVSASCEGRCWQGRVNGVLPLTVRVSLRLGEILTVANELRADLGTDEAGVLRAITPEVDEVVAHIEAALKRLAA